MSEGFELEPFHVPQQSRRDKLRETATSIQGGCAGLLPLYDPSLLSSAMLTCAATDMHHQNPAFIKEEGMNFMGFVGAGSGFLPSSSSAASSSSQLLLDLAQSSVVSANPNYNQEGEGEGEGIGIGINININNSASNPFFYASQIPPNIRGFDPGFDNGGVAFKPHPLPYAPQDTLSTGQGLSLSLSSHYRNRSDAAGPGGGASQVFGDKGVENYVVRGVPGADSMARSSLPIGPFTGYTAILKGSRFLRPAQQLMEEICDVGRGFYVDRSSGESSSSREMESGMVDEGNIGGSDHHGERRRTKARLISMLHEVCFLFFFFY